MRAGQALHALPATDLVQQAAGAAIGIADEDARGAVFPRFENCLLDARRDLLRIGVPDCRKTLQFDVIHSVEAVNGQNFARDRTACDDVNFFRTRAFSV
ncbi:hypothetical protein D3C87_1756810 [compost metagenome]